MKHLFLLTLVLFSIITIAQTTVNPGIVSGNWDNSGSPYYITGDITIPQGMTLNIGSGTQVLFQGNYRLTVEGTLHAIGAQNDSIEFAPADTAGYSNLTTPDGGWNGIYFSPSSLFAADTSKLEYCKIHHAKTISDGYGCIYLRGYSQAILINNCRISDNYSSSWGGGLVAANNTIPNLLILKNTVFSNNEAGTSGGACRISHATGEILNCTFIDNNGSGIMLTEECFNLDIKYNSIINNSNGLLMYNGCTNIFVAENSISGNGEGILTNACSNILLHNNTCSYNTYGINVDACTNLAIIGDTCIYNNYGVHVTNMSSNVYINNNFLAFNNSGGLWSANILNEKITVLGNHIFQNGDYGIAWAAGSGEINSNLIEDNVNIGIFLNIGFAKIYDNNISGSNQGIEIHMQSPDILNNTIHHCNTALSISTGAAPLVDGNFIINNENITSSSVILIFDNAAPRLTNNLIANNTSHNGGGIYIAASSPVMYNNTICNNTANNYGGGIFVTGTSIPVIKNSIFWGNTATGLGQQVFLSSEGSEPEFYFCDLQDGINGIEWWTGTITYNFNYAAGNNMSLVPVFIQETPGAGSTYDAFAADFSLDPGSPCINAGDPSTTMQDAGRTDIALNDRFNVSIDMGAYESGSTVYSFDLQAFPDTIFLGSSMGSSDSVFLTTSFDWVVSFSAGWMGVDKFAGTGDDTLLVAALSNNYSTEQRIDSIEIVGYGQTYAKVIVIQEGITPSLSVFPDNILLAQPASSSSAFSIVSNCDWTIVSDQTWLTATPSDGSNNSLVSVIALSENLTALPRVATLTVSGIGVADKFITVTQEGLNSTDYISNQLTLYPNPNSGSFFLCNPSNEKLEINIFDMSGSLVYSSTGTENNKIVINLDYVKPGIYLINTTSDSGVQYHKLLIQ